MTRARAIKGLASTLSDAARALPFKDRLEFRAFLDRQLHGEHEPRTTKVHSWRKGKKAKITRAPPKQEQLL